VTKLQTEILCIHKNKRRNLRSQCFHFALAWLTPVSAWSRCGY